MKNTRKGLIILGVALMVIIGVGYASINSQTLNINGKASTADASFSVVFDTEHNSNGSIVKSNNVTANSVYTDTKTATFDVSDLKEKGDYAEVIYKVDNESTSLSAQISADVSTQFTETEYLKATVTYSATESGSYANTALTAIPSGSVYVKVKVELLKSTTTAITNSAFAVTVTGSPVETD